MDSESMSKLLLAIVDRIDDFLKERKEAREREEAEKITKEVMKSFDATVAVMSESFMELQEEVKSLDELCKQWHSEEDQSDEELKRDEEEIQRSVDEEKASELTVEEAVRSDEDEREEDRSDEDERKDQFEEQLIGGQSDLEEVNRSPIPVSRKVSQIRMEKNQKKISKRVQKLREIKWYTKPRIQKSNPFKPKKCRSASFHRSMIRKIRKRRVNVEKYWKWRKLWSKRRWQPLRMKLSKRSKGKVTRGEYLKTNPDGRASWTVIYFTAMQWWIWCRQYRRRKLQNDNGGSLCRGKRRMIKKGGKKSWCNRLSRNGGERSTAEESTAWALTTSRRKVKSGYEREKPYNSRIEDPGRKLDCGPWNIKRKIGPNLKLFTNCIMGHPIGNPFHFLQLINSWWLEQASRWIKKECSYGLLSLKAQMRRYVINQEHYWTLPKKVEGSSSFWARTIRGEIEAQLKYHESEESYRCFHEREFSSFLHRFCLISVPRFVRYFHCFLHLSSPYTSNRVLSCVVVADLFKTQNLKTFLLDFGWVGEGVTAVTTQFFHHRIFESKRGTTERKQLIHHRVHINEAAAQIGSVDCCILVFSHSDEVLFVCFSVRNDAWLLLKLGDLPKFKEFWSIYAGFCSFPHHQEWHLLLSRLPYFYDSVAIFPYLYVYATLIVEFIWEDRLPVKVCWTNFPYPSDDSISMFMNGKTIKWVQESELEVSTMVAPEGLQWGGPRVWQWIGAQMVLEIDFGGSKFYFREEPSTCHWGFTDIPGHKDFVVFLEESGTGGSTGDIQTHRVWTGRFLSKFEITKIEGQSDFFIHFAGYRETFCSFAWSTAIFIWLILISVFEWHCIGRGWSCSSVVL